MFARVAVVLVLCGRAFADDPAALAARGEELAKAGEFSRAIQAFKQADAVQPSAAHACLIGLVYTRRELWSQAEIYFAQCRRRATAADPIPDWLPEAERTLAQKLVDTDAAAIDVRVEPAAATVSISSFPPDEAFPPRALHLAPGTYTVTAQAPGFLPAHATIVVASSAAQIVTLVLPRPPPPPPPPPLPPTRAEVIGRDLEIGAVAAVLAGGALHLLALRERGVLDDAQRGNDPVAWDHARGTFELERGLAIGCYGAAIVAGAVGIWLGTHHREGPVVTGSVGAGSATLGIAWRR